MRQNPYETGHMIAMWDTALGELPGRALFEDRLGQVIATHKRSGDKAVLLLLQYPPEISVESRHALAARLSHAVRNTDTVAVFDDVTFAIILTQLKDSENAARVADTLLGAAAECDTSSPRVHVSAGIAVYPDDADEVAAWLVCAADALQGAQGNPLADYAFYTEDMNALIHRRRMLLRDIAAGWASGELSIQALPVINAHTGGNCAAELSLVWQHPVYGLLEERDFASVVGPSGLGPQLFCALCEQALAATLVHPDLYWSIDVATFAGYGSVGPLPFNLQPGDMSRLILVFAERLLSEQPDATIIGMSSWLKMGGKVALALDGLSPLPGAIWGGLPLDQVRAANVDSAAWVSALAVAFDWGLADSTTHGRAPLHGAHPLTWTSAEAGAPLPVATFLGVCVS